MPVVDDNDVRKTGTQITTATLDIILVDSFTRRAIMLLALGLTVVLLLLSGWYLKRLLLKKKVSLTGKHVLITGGSKGIGLATAEYCIKLGASVTILARDQESLDAAKMQLLKLLPSSSSSSSESRQKVQSFSVDVTSDVHLLEQVIASAEEEAGPVFMAVLCAGTSVSGRFDETPVREFKRMLDVNLMGSVNVCQAIIPHMKSRKDGVILLTSSIAGLLGLYGYSAYSASKFAVCGLAQVLHMEVSAVMVVTYVCGSCVTV